MTTNINENIHRFDGLLADVGTQVHRAINVGSLAAHGDLLITHNVLS